jgi:glutathione S-transferase
MFEAFVAPQMALHLSFVESQLATSPNNGRYLCGDHLTAADILMSYPLREAREKACELSPHKTDKKWSEKYPKLWAYLKRLEEEPGFKRAEAKIEELEARKN